MKQTLTRLLGVEPGTIAWKAVILTVGLQTLMKKNKIEIKESAQIAWRFECEENLKTTPNVDP